MINARYQHLTNLVGDKLILAENLMWVLRFVSALSCLWLKFSLILHENLKCNKGVIKPNYLIQ